MPGFTIDSLITAGTTGRQVNIQEALQEEMVSCSKLLIHGERLPQWVDIGVVRVGLVAMQSALSRPPLQRVTEIRDHLPAYVR